MADPTNIRDRSRGAVTTESLSWEAVNAGSLQRIADATEKMAASYDQMRRDRDYWKSRTDAEIARSERLLLQVRSLRGVITRMKKAKA